MNRVHLNNAGKVAVALLPALATLAFTSRDNGLKATLSKGAEMLGFEGPIRPIGSNNSAVVEENFIRVEARNVDPNKDIQPPLLLVNDSAPADRTHFRHDAFQLYAQSNDSGDLIGFRVVPSALDAAKVTNGFDVEIESQGIKGRQEFDPLRHIQAGKVLDFEFVCTATDLPRSMKITWYERSDCGTKFIPNCFRATINKHYEGIPLSATADEWR